jgi:hypothetical protein
VPTQRQYPSIAAGRAGASRRCSRNGCSQPAVATLTYVYADSTAVVGPLAPHASPHSYDLCEPHARSLTAPRGWELMRHEGDFDPPPPVPDDLVAIADAVREPPPAPRSTLESPARTPTRSSGSVRRRGHLRVVP